MNISRDIRLNHSNRKIILRPPNSEDAPDILEAVQASRPALSEWMDWYNPEFSLETAKEWLQTLEAAWEKGNNYQFAIIDQEHQQFLGSCGINHINTTYRFANLGYWIRSDRTGEGLATETTRLLAKFGFQQLGLQRIEIVTAVENGASRRVAEKSGATYEGILRRRMKLGGKHIDAAMYSLIPEDLL